MATINNPVTAQKKFFGEGLTFDDVLLMPAYSDLLPRDVSIETQLTSLIRLNIPMLSAAMDTVTEASLAIALAREGGIGILHKNMSIEQQGGIEAITQSLIETAQNTNSQNVVNYQPPPAAMEPRHLLPAANIVQGGVTHR